MGCPTTECLDTSSDWYQWVTTDTIIDNGALYVSGEPVTNGPGMWELFEEDADRMQADGLTGFRMSLEWSRLFPRDASAATTVEELDALVETAAVARYHEMFQALRQRGVEPLVTLNHYVLPLWVHDGVACHLDIESCEARGWVDTDIIDQIALFSAWCGREFGGEVDTWATLNEPFATVLAGYVLPGEDRSAPPGLSLQGDLAIAVTQNQIVGSARMTDAIREYDTADADGDGVVASVGVVMNMVAIEPETAGDPLDEEAAVHVDHLYHRLFLDGLTSGAWDADIDGEFETTRDDLAGRLDWIGVNYYNKLIAKGLSFSLVPEIPIATVYPEFSWDPYPEGIQEVVEQAAGYGLPVIVTENGTPFVEERGPEILEGHLRGLHAAMENGADVRGYYYWSFVDNYEWNHGMDLRFGLYALDFETKERTARPVLERYREIIRRGGLDAAE